ncbi:FadR/GntR family transcriptional regulator [Amycolatopsis sp. H20-H5]|uniref:FadR/GntR family transcriptional regulator n=1 Tax=Amycolatopsis sp. H20-H5 TaxID=3046309 RepID=UPI002DBFAADD|nr:GntR family transcriptional regulator [Amycolatopsis sp. H20-H5]MEC3976967.1 GntR family transcriptional regulator [Amycolatopsis sp. H20-H5]
MAEFLVNGPYLRDRSGAAEHVLHDLRAQILSGRLVRGARLPAEKELAVRYQVSAPTIREATRALSAMSLVEARQGAGTFVTAEPVELIRLAMGAIVELENIDLPSIIDLSEAFYVKAVELAVARATDEELSELRDAAESFRPSMDDTEFATALRRFLTKLVASSHNKLLITIAAYLLEHQIALAQRAAQRSPSAWRRIAGPLKTERVALAAALQDRNPTQADAAIRTYLKRGRSLVRHNTG